MKSSTINKLNLLNFRFYDKVGMEFDQSRQQFWKGWEQALPELAKVLNSSQTVKILDLACGNARFGRFIDEHFSDKPIEYLGVDVQPVLLSLSEKSLKTTNLTFNLKEVDIIQSLLDDTLINQIEDKFDLIMVFGLLHHIPSEDLRKKFMNKIGLLLNKNGLAVVTSWQFGKMKRFTDRYIDPTSLGIDSNELEANDYILDWNRGEVAYRYSHFADEVELRSLASGFTNTKIIKTYYADGRTDNLNCYIILKKE